MHSERLVGNYMRDFMVSLDKAEAVVPVTGCHCYCECCCLEFRCLDYFGIGEDVWDRGVSIGEVGG